MKRPVIVIPLIILVLIALAGRGYYVLKGRTITLPKTITNTSTKTVPASPTTAIAPLPTTTPVPISLTYSCKQDSDCIIDYGSCKAVNKSSQVNATDKKSCTGTPKCIYGACALLPQ